MANVGKKKKAFFHCLIFVLRSLICRFGKNFEKKLGRKMIEVVAKTWNLFVFSKRSHCQDICKQKSEEQTLASFSSCIAWSSLPNIFFATIRQIDVKIKENDGYCCFTRILNFVSKIFRMAAFTFSSDLLFGYHQQLQFSTNAFSESGREKTVDLVFIVLQNFGTKIKIQKKVLTFCWIALVAA